MKDPTLERIWAARDAIAKRAGYDAKTLVAQLRERELKRNAPENLSEIPVVREPDSGYGE
jgi:hypothetical protein